MVILLTGEKTYVPYADSAEAMIVMHAWRIRPKDSLCEKERRFGNWRATEDIGIHALPLYSLKLNEVKFEKDDRLGGIDGHSFEPC